jgi:hypothetical protein
VSRFGPIPVVLLATVAVVACGGSTAPSKDESLPLPSRSFPDEDASATGTEPDAGRPPLDAGPAGDASDGGGPGCNGALDCERVVFVTKGTYVGAAVGGLAGADAKCQAAAATSTVARIKGHTFRAWLGTAAAPASARLAHGTKPYVLANGTTVAKNWTDLTDGGLNAGISRDETNATTDGGAWTGTNTNGTASASTCGAWDTAQALGQRGNVGGSGDGWTDATNADCTESFHLYCFEE